MSSYFQHAREPMNSFTHFIGIICSIAETACLVLLTCFSGNFTWKAFISVVIFGLSMVALYSASSVYHYVNASTQVLERLRKLDHAMIYVLIAGSYTPVCLKFMPGAQGVLFSSVLWAIALGGSIVKVCWMGAPRWLSTCVYIVMGWSILFAPQVLAALPVGAIVLLLAGGISYTIGAVVYIFKKPNLSPAFGFHELFHVFILFGTFFHFLCVLRYIVY